MQLPIFYHKNRAINQYPAGLTHISDIKVSSEGNRTILACEARKPQNFCKKAGRRCQAMLRPSGNIAEPFSHSYTFYAFPIIEKSALIAQPLIGCWWLLVIVNQ
jgi:hypothetical protein